MVVRSFVSVDLDDEPGALGRMARALGDADINIEGFAVEQGKVRFLVDDGPVALHALRDAGCTPRLMSALEVRLDNQPGQLARLVDQLARDGVRIISTFGVGQDGTGTIYVRCDDELRAAPIVEAFHRDSRAGANAIGWTTRQAAGIDSQA